MTSAFPRGRGARVRGPRLDVPRQGHPLGTEVERLALGFREAAATLMSGISDGARDAYVNSFGPRDLALAGPPGNEDVRAAWALLGMLAVARIAEPKRTRDLESAEVWFFGGECDQRLSGQFDIEAQREAAAIVNHLDAMALSDLLPYAIDPHGPGTRRSVMRDASQQRARTAKRRHGIYYTPGDVADYMTSWVLAGGDSRILDPACGTGVFLRSAARSLVQHLPADQVLARIYGIDLDALAIDAACFVLTATLASTTPARVPAQLWHQARMNIAQRDTLTLQLADGGILQSLTSESSAPADRRGAMRRAMANGQAIPLGVDVARPDARETIGSLFPEAQAEFAVVGNPPYSPLGPRLDLAEFNRRDGALSGARVTPSTNAFLPFMEVMWRLAPSARAALVVPLSIAYNTSQPFRSTRGAMAQAGGTWTLRFFDRTPDALFGDDVKQRVAIALHEPGGDFRLRTSSLLRWTSRQRDQLFGSLPPPVDNGNVAIVASIPKLGSAWELAIYRRLKEARAQMGRTLHEVRLAPGGGTAVADSIEVGTTAYNWLVVYRDRSLTERQVASRRLATTDPVAADWAYGVLNSGLVYWLWRVEGDGFHVPASWVANLPFEWNDTSGARKIAGLGKDAWQFALEHPVRAVNSGRQTVSFRPEGSSYIAAIDRQLLFELGLAPALEGDLSQFRQQTIDVGRETEE